MVISTVSGSSLLGFEFPLHHLVAVRPWTSSFTSLYLSFGICKMEVKIVFTSQDY